MCGSARYAFALTGSWRGAVLIGGTLHCRVNKPGSAPQGPPMDTGRLRYAPSEGVRAFSKESRPTRECGVPPEIRIGDPIVACCGEAGRCVLPFAIKQTRRGSLGAARTTPRCKRSVSGYRPLITVFFQFKGISIIVAVNGPTLVEHVRAHRVHFLALISL